MRSASRPIGGHPNRPVGPPQRPTRTPAGAAVPLQYLELTLPTIVANLALDEALLVEAEAGRIGPTLRIWEPSSHAVVLGASGRIAEDVRLEACRAEGVAIARRSSGGGTVVVGPGAVNVAVVVRVDAAPEYRAVDTAQVAVLARFAAGLRGLEPRLEVLGSGDLAIEGRKVSGSAQRRLRSYFLVHATILNEFDLPMIGRCTNLPRRQPSYRADRPHDAFVRNLDLLRDPLLQALRAGWIDPDALDAPVSIPSALVDELVRSKFADPGWIERL